MNSFAFCHVVLHPFQLSPPVSVLTAESSDSVLLLPSVLSLFILLNLTLSSSWSISFFIKPITTIHIYPAKEYSTVLFLNFYSSLIHNIFPSVFPSSTPTRTSYHLISLSTLPPSPSTTTTKKPGILIYNNIGRDPLIKAGLGNPVEEKESQAHAKESETPSLSLLGVLQKPQAK